MRRLEWESITPRKALERIREEQCKIGRRRSRIHDEAAAKRVSMMEIIQNSLCSDCPEFDPKAATIGKRVVVALGCKAGSSPVEIHYRASFGGAPVCPSRVEGT